MLSLMEYGARFYKEDKISPTLVFMKEDLGDGKSCLMVYVKDRTAKSDEERYVVSNLSTEEVIELKDYLELYLKGEGVV